MVLTDPVTRPVNRRGLDQTLTREVSCSRRGGSELWVLTLDRDHFKNVNDTDPSGASRVEVRMS